MRNVYVVFTICLLISATGSKADETDQELIYTSSGIVHYVSADVTAETLATLLFPHHQKTTTRSIFGNTRKKHVNATPLSIAMQIHFEFDSALLTEDAKARLSTIGRMLQLPELADTRLIIEGHTDVVGTRHYNLGLSFRRADSVKQYLVKNHAIKSHRLDIRGKGESELIDLTNPASITNRRVQFSDATLESQ